MRWLRVFQNLASTSVYIFNFLFRNSKHFPCFHTAIETRVEVWENEKLKWKHWPAGRVIPRKTSTSASITFFYHRKKYLFLL